MLRLTEIDMQIWKVLHLRPQFKNMRGVVISCVDCSVGADKSSSSRNSNPKTDQWETHISLRAPGSIE